MLNNSLEVSSKLSPP